MPRQLFGTSGIRKVVNVGLTPETAVKVGLAVATLKKKAVVAHDSRTSSPMLENALLAGLLAGGSDVQRMGLIPTPALAYLTRELKADVGVMITASHNPPEYNGIKLFCRDSAPYNDEMQREIEQIINEQKYERQKWDSIGEAVTSERIDKYVELIESSVQLQQQWKVVLDPGCGAASLVAPRIFRSAGCDVTVINGQPDGFFPGRKPLPDSESLQPLGRLVKSLSADVGIAFDGDGDRMVLVGEDGVLTSPDRTLAAFAVHAVKKNNGGTVVTHVEASACIEHALRSYDGRVFRTKVGDASIAEAVKREKAVFGGEPCGAWIHPQYHFCPDGILSSILILKVLEEEGKTLSAFVAQIPKYLLVREAAGCPSEVAPSILIELERKLPPMFGEVAVKAVSDGVKGALDEVWFLIRPSGTEPLMRITVEGKELKKVQNTAETLKKVVEKLVAGETG